MTPKRLKELLYYDPETGIFTWLRTGNVAGGVDEKGYVRIRLDGRKYRAHRLAWLYVTGDWPDQIDHKDMDKANNVFANLRSTTNVGNNGNRLRQSNNTSGFRGVYWFKPRQRWVALLAGKRLGSFRTKEEAAVVYVAAAQQHFGEFYRATGG